MPPVPTPTASPSPVATASVAASPEPTPTPEPHGVETNHALSICDQWSGWHRPFLHWAQDGSLIVFDAYDTIWTLELEDARLREIADVDQNYNPLYSQSSVELTYGFYADLSPDGSRIVYSTCEYVIIGSARPYEVAMVNVDGTERRRLTKTETPDGHPAWSPDGTHVAFAPYRETRPFRGIHLAIMAVETGELRLLVPQAEVHPLHPPVWSPDGQRLAYIADEGSSFNDGVLYITEAGVSKPTRIRETTVPTVDVPEPIRIGETQVLPAWSPDSEEIAVAMIEGEESVLYAAKADGTGMRELWRSGADDTSSLPISHVSWSPDGTEVLFVVADGVQIVRPDGSGVRTLAGSDARGFVVPGSTPWSPSSAAPLRLGRFRWQWASVTAEWSPDGSMIALHGPEGGVDIVNRDGSNWRNLVWVAEDDGAVHSVNTPVDRAVCSAGIVVPEPEANPGLVKDCRTLVGIWNYYGWDELAWDTSAPITEWEGVVVGGSPPRVRELRLPARVSSHEITLIPPELSNLAELRVLDFNDNFLGEQIPAELANLTELRVVTGLSSLQQVYVRGDEPDTVLEVDSCLPAALPAIWVWASRLERCAE